MYQKRNSDIEFVSVSSEDFNNHLFGQQGVTFAVYIPSLGNLHPDTVVRPVAVGDAIAIPICLVSLKNRKSEAYLIFERWLTSALLVLDGRPLDNVF